MDIPLIAIQFYYWLLHVTQLEDMSIGASTTLSLNNKEFEDNGGRAKTPRSIHCPDLQLFALSDPNSLLTIILYHSQMLQFAFFMFPLQTAGCCVRFTLGNHFDHNG